MIRTRCTLEGAFIITCTYIDNIIKGSSNIVEKEKAK